MGSNRFKYYSQERFDGGIEQRDVFARKNQVKDARNVWVPAGEDELVTRLGFQYVTGFPDPLVAEAVDTAIKSVVEDPPGVFQEWFTYTNPSARIYWGLETADPTAVGFLLYDVDAQNSSAVQVRWDYWNGVEWAPITVHELQRLSGSDYVFGRARHFLDNPSSADGGLFVFATPADWAALELDGIERYWLRITQINNVTPDAIVIPQTKYRLLRSAVYGHAWVPYSGGVLALTLGDKVIDGGFSSGGAALESTIALALTAMAANSGHVLLDPTGYASTGYGYRYISAGEGVRSDTADMQSGTFAASPMRVAAIPQTSDVFVAYRNQVYNVAPTRLKRVLSLLAEDGSLSAVNYGALRNYFDAKVEDDPVYVADPLSPLNRDTVPQLDVFPPASSILYNANLLWATKILGEPGVIRWTAPAVAGIYLGYRVWPKLNFAVLPSNQEVTAQAALHENTIVTTKDAVFSMVATGTDLNNFTTYAPVRVCDVGCLSEASVQNIPGRLVWYANEGFHVFDGTPNVRRISDAIKPTIDTINKGRAEYMASAHWDFYNCYVVAVPLNGSDKNNALLVFDYERGAWWIWDGINARFLYVLDDTLHFMDYNGNVFAFQGTHDYGAPIQAHFTTHRLGKDERISKTARDVRITAYGEDVQASIVAGDHEEDANDIEFGFSSDAVFGTAVFDTATFPDDNLKERHIGERIEGRWFQLKVSCASKTTPLRVHDCAVGVIDKGRR